MRFRFGPALSRRPWLTAGDAVVLLALAALLSAGVSMAWRAPAVQRGPIISLAPSALPVYALLSTARMAAAYCLSLAFTLVYGYAAGRSRSARRVLIPVLDVLQSVPILSFLPVVLLGLSAVLPQKPAAEIAAILLIFTSQAWNMTYSFYQSMTTIPNELREAASVFRFGPWLRFKTLEMPFSALGLIWNSMMSWAGGWFFLMAAEIFTVGARDFRLPGLGAYLQEAANRGDSRAVLYGIVTLVATIVVLDQVLWRPLLAWADKFRVDTLSGEEPFTSWFGHLLSRSVLLDRARARLIEPLAERVDTVLSRRLRDAPDAPAGARAARPSTITLLASGALALLVLYGAYRAMGMLAALPMATWRPLLSGLGATFLRVAAALLIALAWTVPAGVAIGMNRRLATFVQPIVQVVASIPATALFPVIVVALLSVPGGLNIAAIVLMLMGTQWYLLFNVIAGASAIPQDLRFTTDLLRLPLLDRWRVLILPAIFPYVVTGAITAGGGAWNASIVAEHAEFGGRSHSTTGIGALIAGATSRGDYPLLLASTLALIATVVLINRTFWRSMYRLAEERYRME
ncbi:MAG TPA: ABC transporter permease subunit [Candidatus Dormibacteraeota bacterium]|nr:ABC transporter permease subunit [Candidatus Dormibacteraeota bacterium]